MKVIEHAWRWAGSLSKRYGKVDYLILHHAAAVTASPETIHSWHLSRGWKGIAYHYVVRKDGSVHRGRPEWAVGGHTRGHNRELGLCAEGDFTREAMPKVQQAALTMLVADIRKRYPGIRVVKHSTLNPTACPGRNYPFSAILSGAPRPMPKPAPVPPVMPLVKLGSRNDAVKALQIRLRSLGFKGRYYRPLVADGIFGKNTLIAVRRYQRDAGLAIDGIVGPKTWRALGY